MLNRNYFSKCWTSPPVSWSSYVGSAWREGDYSASLHAFVVPPQVEPEKAKLLKTKNKSERWCFEDGSHPTLSNEKRPTYRLIFLRREGDSNPRYVSVNTLSKRARSATLPPLQLLLSKAPTKLQIQSTLKNRLVYFFLVI